MGRRRRNYSRGKTKGQPKHGGRRRMSGIRGRDIGAYEGGVIVTKIEPESEYQMDPYYKTESWKQKRLYVCRRDEGICQYCENIGAFMADHVIPRKRGGSDKVENLVCCCGRCNKIAGNRVFDSFETKKAWIMEQRKAGACLKH